MSSVNGVNSSTQTYQSNYAAYTSQDNKTTDKAVEADVSDSVELGTEQPVKQTYSMDKATISKLKAIADSNMNTVRSLVEKLLSSQSYTVSGNFNAAFEAWGSLQADEDVMASFGFKMDFSFSFEFSSSDAKAVQEEAQALIAEDGPLGVKQVSQNILDFAKAISGGDPSKIELLRNACQKGYDEVAALFGGADKMPEISQKTLEAVMQGFDDWANEVAALSS